MKKSKIIKLLLGILGLGIFIFFLMSNDFEKKIKILDCEGIYYSKIYDNSKTDLSYINAKVDVTKCLCEKYEINKSEKYKTEILKLYENFESDYKEKHQKPNIDSICKYKDDIFWKMYYE